MQENMLCVPSILITFCQHEIQKKCHWCLPKEKVSRLSLLLSHLTNVRGNKLNWNRSFLGERHPLVLLYTSHIISRSFPGSFLISCHQWISLCVPALAPLPRSNHRQSSYDSRASGTSSTRFINFPLDISRLNRSNTLLSLFSTLGCLTAKKKLHCTQLMNKI